jgi:hypothetical protein
METNDWQAIPYVVSVVGYVQPRERISLLTIL